MTEPSPLLLFLHIPKTAGSTLAHIIRRQYPPDTILLQHQPTFQQTIQALPGGRIESLRVIMGHLWFGVHALVPRPVTYVTVLRDPIERVISHYYFVQRDPEHHLHQVSRGMSLQDYVTSGCSTELQNDQTRLLAGAAPPDSTRSPGEMLAAARRNLDQHFAVVGLTEEFDRSLILIKRRFGWRNPFYLKKNVTRHPAKSHIPAETLRVVEEHNQLDLELYRYAQARFHEQVQSQDASFEQELRHFRSLNASYGKIVTFITSAADKLGKARAGAK